MIEKTVCAICGETGGVFRFRGDKWVHKNCARPVRVIHSPVFPFSTGHLSEPWEVAEGGPVVINNMRELRRYEHESGTVCDPYSSDSDSVTNRRY